jgi:hypothetical protein
MQSFFLKISLFLSSFLMLQSTVFAQAHDKARKQPNDVASDSKNTEKKDSTAKPKAEEADFERWYYGGNLGFSGLNGGFAANISPLVGYRLQPKFMVGGGIIGVGVSSSVSKGNNSAPAFFGQYGLRAFTRYDLFSGVFAHGELSQAWNAVPEDITTTNKVIYKTTPLPSALVGLGLNLGTGHVRINATVLYNLLYGLYDTDQLNSNQYNYNSYTIQSLPGVQIQGGIGFGF